MRFEEDQRRMRAEERNVVFRSRSLDRSNVLQHQFSRSIEKANDMASRAKAYKDPQKRLDMYRSALDIYVPLLRKTKHLLDGAGKKNLLRKVESCMEAAEYAKKELETKSRKGICGDCLYFNGGMAEWCWLDNIACQVPIILHELTWPSTEHFFQAQKFEDPSLRERIRKTMDPIEAKRLGRTSKPLRSNWEEIKIGVMYEATRAKFRQHESLRSKLADTAPYTIVEHCGDRIWGDGGDGCGKNLLGKILTRVRDEIIEKASSEKDAAAATLNNAIAADQAGNRDDALQLYKRGIAKYLKIAKSLPKKDRDSIFKMLSQCVARAELLDKRQRRNSMEKRRSLSGAAAPAPSAPPIPTAIPITPVIVLPTTSPVIPTVSDVVVVEP